MEREPVVTLTRARLVVPGVGSVKCNLGAARRALADLPGAYVESSEVTLYVDGSEWLGPWEPIMVKAEGT